MTTLYTIAEQFKELAALAETADEDLAVALRDTMEGIEGEFQEKGKAIAMITLNIDGDLEAIQSQIDRLTERKRIINNRKESLKEYLRTNMDAAGITKITHPLFTITCGKGKGIAGRYGITFPIRPKLPSPPNKVDSIRDAFLVVRIGECIAAGVSRQQCCIKLKISSTLLYRLIKEYEIDYPKLKPAFR